MTIQRMADIDLSGKRVLIRQDLNVPIQDGKITSDTRIKCSIPTINLALEKGAKVMIMSHLGRPNEGQINDEYSLAPVAESLTKLLGQNVKLIKNYLNQSIELKNGEVVLLENVRFNAGESKNDEKLAKSYANLCDVYVMDAFGSAHRKQASTYGVGLFANTACSGPLLSNELDALSRALENPKRPMVAIVGGSKVSTKLSVLENLSNKVDQLLVGGGIANTFILAAGNKIGNSLAEEDLVPVAEKLLKATQAKGGVIPIPTDVIAGKEFSKEATAHYREISEVESDDMIFDIGHKSANQLANIIKNAGTIIWNGPVGVFEFEQFGSGTETISQAIADSQGFSIAGGGDTLAAIEKYKIEDKVSYISTGGGAFLEFLEGKKLPAVEMLEQK